MKFVLVVLAVLVLLWLLRGTLRKSRLRPGRPDVPPSPQQPMLLTCAHCGVHLPRDEALPGRGGVFCDDAHRTAFEKAHPDP